ncbi:restriction endonuclease subunit S [Paraneptunicella aestuarii]|uniref:restriction endonuclease subunit S n=1 Tax=Paraneptunicella aestuarii TaxID=2831148 RepID=UPI001E5FA608|nr:restriction endonuclease subunit S [Paraneptunicella aestuarii]UAA37730.1 restriction endonuclease subunit S [Paraneptunicella aestuarii]
MTGRYKAYPEYKDSDVEWLEKLPTHWGSKALKFLCSYNDEVISETTDYDTEIEYVDIGSVSAVEGIFKTEKIAFGKSPSRARRIVRDGDVIVSTVRTYLEAIAPIVKPPENMIVSTGFAVIRPNNQIEKRFAAYCLRAKGFIREVVSRSVGISYPAINASELVKINVPNLPYQEQQKIANFLDHETAKIDTLIAKQEKLIELLKEKRQAVISHAVTKGLNPDAPMKDSGVEWLGEVPEHWEIAPIKYLIELTPKKSQMKAKYSDFCNFVPMEKLKQDILILDEQRKISSVYDGYTYFENEDILMAKVTPCFENKNMVVARGLLNGIGFGSSEIYVLRCNRKVLNDFLYYRLQEDSFMNIATAAMTGAGGLKRVPADVITNYQVALPPIKEQIEITQDLKNKLGSFDVLMDKACGGIELMKERKTALISAAVTGKIDVRNWESTQ